MKYFTNKLNIAALIALSAGLIIINFASAQTQPEFIISWRTNAYVPSTYAGKIIPSAGSMVDISFDVLENGKLIDVSGKKIKWSSSGKTLQTGTGLKNIIFTISSTETSEKSISISIADYKGATLDKTISIPIASPKIIIDAPIPGKEISIGQDYTFRALPYFFNVPSLSNLSFEWQMGGQNLEQTNPLRPDILSANLNSQFKITYNTISLSVIVKNISNQLETAAKTINLNLK
ncbi:MAG: hypothetical protein PHP03_02090 [Candidatus Pacebacteria bacterium]|nr:hypothetical protein [Candidatus Paceibacterota bacterium]